MLNGYVSNKACGLLFIEVIQDQLLSAPVDLEYEALGVVISVISSKSLHYFIDIISFYAFL